MVHLEWFYLRCQFVCMGQTLWLFFEALLLSWGGDFYNWLKEKPMQICSLKTGHTLFNVNRPPSIQWKKNKYVPFYTYRGGPFILLNCDFYTLHVRVSYFAYSLNSKAFVVPYMYFLETVHFHVQQFIRGRKKFQCSSTYFSGLNFMESLGIFPEPFLKILIVF